MRRSSSGRVLGPVSLGLVTCVTVAVTLTAGTGTARAVITDRCAGLAHTLIADTTITQTAVVPATGPIPEYCRVDGHVTTPGDDIVPSNSVNFRVGLPTRWNSDFFFQGVGGLAGVIGPLDAGLRRGYASASTDTGHQGTAKLGNPILDGGWALNNRPKQIDYGYRGVHVATIAAKEITRAYYDRAPRRSIFNGCSNGGRQGFMEAQRFPADYNGVISVAPAFNAIDAITTWIWQMQAQLAKPGAWISPAELPVLSAASLRQYDARDGLIDGLVSNPEKARFRPGRLATGDSLTPAQVKTAKAIYAGHGRRAQGWPVGHEEGWQSYITGSVAPVSGPDGRLVFPFSPAAPAANTFTNEFLRYFFFSDPTYDLTAFDLTTDLPILERARPMLDATDPDLSAFQARGGKLLVAHGWADPALSAYSLIDYHRDVVATMGRSTEDFFRLFMAPGMFHCAGGPGPDQFDALTAMERWLDQGVAPDAITATNQVSGRSRPLCPYPAWPVYDGSGSIEEAANFTCGSSHPR